MTFKVDGALYPDVDPPAELDSLADRIDFVARLCSAWDFGRLPDAETVEEIRKSGWRQAIDQCGLLTSPVYHMLREWHGLPEAPFLGALPSYIVNDPNLDYV